MSDPFLFAQEPEHEEGARLQPWKLLIVDDDESIHHITKLALGDFEFDDRKIEFLHAYSGEEAINLFTEHQDVALILLDVIMETEDAGFEVIKYIRNIMKHNLVRIIMRTGQPGTVPAQDIIRQYDISDYKAKTDLTNIRLYTSVISSFRSYKELQHVESNNQALLRLVELNDSLIECTTVSELISNVINELRNKLPFTKVFDREPTSNLILECRDKSYNLLAGNGVFSPLLKSKSLSAELTKLVFKAVASKKFEQDESFTVVPVETKSQQGALALVTTNTEMDNEWERKLIRLFTHNLSVSIDSLFSIEKLENNNCELEQQVRRRTKQLEEEKFRAESANKAKSVFLSNMSHEIRTPMNAILGYTQLLKNDEQIPNEQKEQLKKVEKAGYHLLELINDILDISKIEAGKMELQESTFYLSTLINDINNTFLPLAEKKGIHWLVNNQVLVNTPVKGDFNKLMQVVNNLVGNAIKFTEHGSVTLSITPEQRNSYAVEVVDTGAGIAEHEIKHLFNAFEQGREGNLKGGTGLGLTISSRFLTMMGGHLHVDSTPAQGSRFYFVIELLPGDVCDVDTKEQPLERLMLANNEHLTALVVDDIKVNITILSAVLQRIGIEVLTATNGIEAIEVLDNTPVDIVFMDILMPEMNGDDAIRIIRENYSKEQLPIIAVTAYSMIEEIEYFIDIGFNRYLSKPYRFAVIHDCLMSFFPNKFEVVERLAEPNLGEKASLHDTSITRKDWPEGRITMIIEAAELNKMSLLKCLFDQTIEDSPPLVTFVSRLQSYLDNYDTESILCAMQEFQA